MPEREYPAFFSFMGCTLLSGMRSFIMLWAQERKKAGSISKCFENEHTLINTRERITEKGKSAPVPRVNVYIDFTPSLHTCQILSINIFLCNHIVSYFPASVNTFCEILIISAFYTKIFLCKKVAANDMSYKLLYRPEDACFTFSAPLPKCIVL